MKILSIETSCDDTAITIMEAKGGITSASFKVLADGSNSQIKVHIPYGGVFPTLAKQEHIKNLPIILDIVLKQAKLDKKKKPVDAVAVTYGPGLEMSLWTGIMFAKDLAKKWKVPLVPVNHMEGHVLSVYGKGKGSFKIPKVETPALSLLVSGGHTQLILIKKWMEYEILGETLDDAVGEAFDKVARMVGLPYPGGPAISKLAEEARLLQERSIAQADEPSIAIRQQANMRAESLQKSGVNLFKLPRPMLHSKDFNFSFAGLKTAVLYLIKKLGTIDEQTKSAIALEFENAAIECLVHKTKKAVEKYGVKNILVGGGVACNKHLQNELNKMAKNMSGKKIKALFPPREVTGDNSLMIGMAGYLRYLKRKASPKGLRPRGKFGRPSSIKATGKLKLGPYITKF